MLSDGLDLLVDGGQVVVRWNGAKVSKHSGQPWRQCKLKPDVLPEEMLKQVEATGVLKVSIATVVRINQRTATVDIGNGHSWRVPFHMLRHVLDI